jgi:hypothetical protein
MYIHQYQVGLQPLAQRVGFAAARCLANNFPARVTTQQVSKAHPDHRIIVGHDQLDRCVVCVALGCQGRGQSRGSASLQRKVET